jgi:hypothetical protein
MLHENIKSKREKILQEDINDKKQYNLLKDFINDTRPTKMQSNITQVHSSHYYMIISTFRNILRNFKQNSKSHNLSFGILRELNEIDGLFHAAMDGFLTKKQRKILYHNHKKDYNEKYTFYNNDYSDFSEIASVCSFVLMFGDLLEKKDKEYTFPFIKKLCKKDLPLKDDQIDELINTYLLETLDFGQLPEELIPNIISLKLNNL